MALAWVAAAVAVAAPLATWPLLRLLLQQQERATAACVVCLFGVYRQRTLFIFVCTAGILAAGAAQNAEAHSLKKTSLRPPAAAAAAATAATTVTSLLQLPSLSDQAAHQEELAKAYARQVQTARQNSKANGSLNPKP